MNVQEGGTSAAGDLRRSTRVAMRVRVEVQGTGFSCEGETVVVNLHGALVETSAVLEVGTPITIHVQITGKSAAARIVFASRERALYFGVELEKPQNIWGVTLTPPDWEQRFSDR